jgi:hypothetical protein
MPSAPFPPPARLAEPHRAVAKLRSLTLGCLTVGILATTGCAGTGDSNDRPDTVQEKATGGELSARSDAPPECQDAFPLALEPASLDDVTLIPSDWPQPPAGATLCGTSHTLDGNIETLDYALAADSTDVLDAYESALPETYTSMREDDGLGEVITGTGGGVSFEITPRDGSFTLFFNPA